MPFSRMKMPQLGESVREGTISKWLVKPGDRIVEFQPMLEVDTDKVNAEIPSPATGIVQSLLVEEGQTVAVGTEIVVLEVEAEGQSSTAAAVPAALPTETTDTRPSPGGAVSPAVSMLARQNNLDVAGIVGSGLNGRVTKKDVRRALESQPAQRTGEAATSQAPERVVFGDDDTIVPLTHIRRLIAENVTRSKATIPHAWQTQEVDMSGVVAHRAANKDRFLNQEGFGLTYLPYVLAATHAGLRANPMVNSTFTESGIVLRRNINLGVAIGLEDSVVVPVIRNAESLSIAGFARAVNDLSDRARKRKLTADDLVGGTFTVNNSGTFGTLLSYSVINPGQAGILTMGAIVERPVARNGTLSIAHVMYLSFSLDHRILDGLSAARFLSACRAWLEGVGLASPLQ